MAKEYKIRVIQEIQYTPTETSIGKDSTNFNKISNKGVNTSGNKGIGKNALLNKAKGLGSFALIKATIKTSLALEASRLTKQGDTAEANMIKAISNPISIPIKMIKNRQTLIQDQARTRYLNEQTMSRTDNSRGEYFTFKLG